MIELIIRNKNKIYMPILQEGISWETFRKGQPGKLSFSVVQDYTLDIQEGNMVRLKVDGQPVFYGFIFKKSRKKDGVISITAYDQLRYFKNKDTYVYKNKTTTELLKMISQDFMLNLGTLDDTKYKIASKIEDNKTLFDMVQNSLDDTLRNTKKMYVLYDSFGKLELKDIESMKIDYLLNAESAEDFSYDSTIDKSYNKIKLACPNEKSGKRDVYIAKDTANINDWGILQYYEKIDANANGKAKADALLQLNNKKTRSLKISGAFGDLRIRGGCSIPVKLDLGDISIQNYMLVENVKHSFKYGQHSMDLTLKGGAFFV